MLLILVLKIIAGLYLIVCVGSFVRSFFLQKKKCLVVKKKKNKTKDNKNSFQKTQKLCFLYFQNLFSGIYFKNRNQIDPKIALSVFLKTILKNRFQKHKTNRPKMPF